MQHKKYSSFADLSDLYESGGIELYRAVETITHKDENTANNRLFVWNFEEQDLEEFVHIFTSYKNEVPCASARQNLNGKIFRKMNSMLREDYNPIECMLYASKIINFKLQSDRELQEILAERVKDIYMRHETETIAVFKNIMKMWTWIAQIKVVINAIGLIGDNEDLLDDILFNYAEDSQLRLNVFNALMRNKSSSNLERAMKIIMNLGDTNEDVTLGKIFKREIMEFGLEGIKIVEKYYNNPGVNRAGGKIIKSILLKSNRVNSGDDFYRNALARKSVNDDNAYNDFLADCMEKNDDKALYLCRYSRLEMGAYLKEILKEGNIFRRSKNTAIISMAFLGLKGYTPANSVIDSMQDDNECEYAVVVARIILGNETYAFKLADILSEKNDYELNELYSILNEAYIVNFPKPLMLVRKALLDKFDKLIGENETDNELDAFCSNLQMFWNKKLYGLIPNELLIRINDILKEYANDKLSIRDDIVVSMIEVITQSYNTNVEATLFLLYQSPNRKIKEISFRKLKGRQMEAPK